MGFSAPSIPQPSAPAPPPLPVDPAVMERRRRSQLQRRAGRLSTILTGPGGLVNRATISPPSLLGGGGTALGRGT
jgi:hypothetical protein